jgi:hypothetical protein
MGLTTRREIFKSSGLLVAMSATEMLPKSLLAQPPSMEQESSIGISSGLGNYVSDATKVLINSISEGNLTSYNLKHVASATHLMARHIERSGFDRQWKMSFNQFDFDAYSSKHEEYCKQKAAALAQYDSTLSQGVISADEMSSDEFKNIKAKMSAIGSLSGILHMTADTYLIAKTKVPSSAYQPAVWNHARNTTSTSGRYGTPRFRLVCDGHEGDRKTICKHFNMTSKGIEITGGVLAAIGALCVAELITGPLEPVLCGIGASALGLSLFFHGLALEKLIEMAGC